MTERSTHISVTTPELGSVWIHTNGTVYTVLNVANINATDIVRYPVLIVYADQRGQVWARPMADWHRSMTPAKHTRISNGSAYE